MGKIKANFAWLGGLAANNVILSDRAIEQVRAILRDGVPLQDRWDGKVIGSCLMVNDDIFVKVFPECSFLIIPELTAPAMTIVVDSNPMRMADGIQIVDNVNWVTNVFIKRRENDGSSFVYVP